MRNERSQAGSTANVVFRNVSLILITDQAMGKVVLLNFANLAGEWTVEIGERLKNFQGRHKCFFGQAMPALPPPWLRA